MDLDINPKPTVVSEFLAVILAGFGNELVPLTSEHGDEACPKALLPVANKPLIDYVLSWVEQSGITDVLIICPSIHRPAIYHHIHSKISPSLHIEFHPFEESQNSPAGTCKLLRHFTDRLVKDKQDFVVLPCDFIPPSSLALNSLLNKFRADCISDDSLVTTCWIPTFQSEKGVYPEDWTSSSPSSAILWDPSTASLLHIDTLDDIDKNSDAFELKTYLFARSEEYPSCRLSRRYRDSHIYVCKRRVLDLLKEKRHFDSFREDFIPWLCAQEHHRHQPKQPQDVETDGPRKDILLHSTLQDPKHARVGIVVHQGDSGARVNSLEAFAEMNRQSLSKASYSLPSDPKDRALIDQKAQISADTMVDVSTQIAERVTIKKSVIGKHCIIGKGARITGSVLLDHCVISENAKIDGSLLGTNTKVGVKAELVKCITQAGYEVDSGQVLKHEKLEVSDWSHTADDEVDSSSSGESESE